MPVANVDIDRIVEEVVRRLSVAVGDQRDVAERASEYVLHERLVTLSTIESRLPKEVATLCVPQGAVITPSARDLLRDRKIAIVTQADEPPAQVAVAQVATAQIGSVNSASASRLSQLGDATPLRAGCSRELIKQLIDGVNRGTFARAVVLAQHPLAVACLCNRRQVLRAAPAACEEGVKAARTTIDANVLVLDGRLSADKVEELAAQFVAAGPRQQRPEYQEFTPR